jgi:hypothetical protein
LQLTRGIVEIWLPRKQIGNYRRIGAGTGVQLKRSALGGGRALLQTGTPSMKEHP